MSAALLLALSCASPPSMPTASAPAAAVSTPAARSAERSFWDELQYEFIVKSAARWQVDNGDSSEFFNTLSGNEPQCTMNDQCPSGAVCFMGTCRVRNQQYDPSGENFGDLVTTFGTNLRWKAFAATARFDTALYMRPPEAAEGASPFIQDRLSSRYENQIQPEFLALTYSDRFVELTVGDYYVTLGRGMSLAVRIVDDVGVDNKLRGQEAKIHAGPVDLHLFYGVLNIKNFEPGTGFAYEDTGDLMGGGRVEYRFGKYLKLGTHVAVISTPVIEGNQTGFINQGGTVELPRPAKWFNAYFEYAFMNRTRRLGEFRQELEQEGFGLYGNVNFYVGPVTLLVEGKAYDNMLSILPGDATSELAQRRQNINRLSEPPTAERFGATILSNSTVYGGRARVDVSISPQFVPYVSYGHYEDGGCGLFGFRGRAGGVDDCTDDGTPPENAPPKSYVNAIFAGLRTRWEGGDLSAEGGYRGQFYFSDQQPIAENLSRLYFQESHGQVDVHQKLGDYSLELFVLGKALNDISNEWMEQRVAVTLGHDAGWSVTTAYEYTDISPNSREHYPSLAGQWQVSDEVLIRGLVGGERPGLKCSGGACRFFPGFEGVRLELSARF